MRCPTMAREGPLLRLWIEVGTFTHHHLDDLATPAAGGAWPPACTESQHG